MNLVDFVNKVESEKVTAFPMHLSGSSSGATKKSLAKISMAFPTEVVGRNLDDLKKWEIYVIAIEKEEHDRVIDTEKDES